MNLPTDEDALVQLDTGQNNDCQGENTNQNILIC